MRQCVSGGYIRGVTQRVAFISLAHDGDRSVSRTASVSAAALAEGFVAFRVSRDPSEVARRMREAVGISVDVGLGLRTYHVACTQKAVFKKKSQKRIDIFRNFA